jgi:hypothetical protein
MTAGSSICEMEMMRKKESLKSRNALSALSKLYKERRDLESWRTAIIHSAMIALRIGDRLTSRT